MAKTIVITIPDGADEISYTSNLNKVAKNLDAKNIQLLGDLAHKVPNVNNTIRSLLQSPQAKLGLMAYGVKV